MAVWVWVTLAAAAAQTIRGAGQQGLKPKLGDFGASLIRFSYAVPFAWAWIYLYGEIAGQKIPVWNQSFLLWVTIAAVMQIIFTVMLVMLFSHRSFAAGTAFSKTEVIQAAIFEALIIGFVVSAQVGLAIVIGVVAVFFLSLIKSSLTIGNLMRSLLTRQTAIGLASGAKPWILHGCLSCGHRFAARCGSDDAGQPVRWSFGADPDGAVGRFHVGAGTRSTDCYIC